MLASFTPKNAQNPCSDREKLKDARVALFTGDEASKDARVALFGFVQRWRGFSCHSESKDANSEY